jgi:hypothetical protein
VIELCAAALAAAVRDGALGRITVEKAAVTSHTIRR